MSSSYRQQQRRHDIERRRQRRRRGRRPRWQNRTSFRIPKHLLAVAVVAVAAIGLVAGLTYAGVFKTSYSVADITARPQYAQVVYQVVNSSSGDSVRTWEVLTLDRPFDVTDLTYAKPPSSGASPQSGTISTYNELYQVQSGDQLQAVSGRPPAPGSGDQALGPELADLVLRGLARPAHRNMTIAGRRCEVVTFAEPPAGPITPLSASEHDNLCIDSLGLVLAEQWTYHGKLVLTRTALSVALDPASAGHFTGAPPLSKAKSDAGTQLIAITPGASQSFLNTPPAPAGYMTDQAVSTLSDNPLQPGTVSAGADVWAFSQGGNTITVTAGEGAQPWGTNDTPTRSVKLQLGRALTALTSLGPEIRIPLSQNRWVVVDGTVPLDQLVSYASGLTLSSS